MKDLFRRKEQFSIRKFTVGVASVMIGASLIAGSEIKAADNKNVEVHYVADSDLTEAEKAALKKFEENQVVNEDTIAYYYVYKKNAKDGVLPNTTTTPLKGIAIAGTSLLVLALFVSKRKNKIITVCAFAVGMSGILNTTVLANSDFERFFENVEVTVGGKLPTPKQISGYTFTGYYFTKEKEQEVKPTEPINPVAPINPTKPEEPKVLPKEAKGDQTGIEIVNDQPTPKDDKDEYEEYMLNGKAGTPEAKVREKDETTVIPYNTVTKEDSTLEKGQTKVEVEGKNGQKVAKVREFYTVSRNGEQVVFRDVLSEQEIPAVDRVVLVGTKGETPVSPTEPTKPVEPVTPTEPTKPVEPVTPTEPTNPVEPVSPTEPTNPADPVNPTEPTKPVEPVTPIEPTKPVEPVIPTEPTKPVEPVTPTEPTTPEQPEVPQPKFVTEDIEPTISYEADEALEVGQSATTKGKKGKKITTTTYERDSVTGEIKEKTETRVIEEAGVTVVKVGTKPTTKSENLAPIYKANNEQAYNTPNVETEGTPKITTTTYSVNPTTGEVTPKEEVTGQGKPKEISVGTKSTEKREELPVVYKRNDEQEFGTDTEEPGVEKVTTTTYTVDATTGKVTPKEEVTEQGKAKVVTKGTKPKVEEKTINFTTTYKADEQTPYNTKVEETKGINGKTVTTTTYSLNEQTGEVTENTPTTETTQPTNAIVKVGNVQTTTSEIEITEREEKDKDPELEKGKTRVVTEGEKGETTTTTTYDVDSTTGELSNPKSSSPQITKEMKQRVIAKGTKEDIEKKIDFNDVTKRELYRITDNGKMEPVTGLTQAPLDTSKYVLKLTRQNHKDVILPVDSIVEKGTGFEIEYNGVEYNEPEKMMIGKVKTYEGAYTQFDKLLEAIKANPSGVYTIGADLVATPLLANEVAYISNFTGTLKSADDSKNFTIGTLTKPLFNTLGGTVQNINLDVNVDAAKSAALAISANNATITNVHAKGNVKGTADAAGLVIDVTGNSKLTDVSFSGNLTYDRNPRSTNNLESGGIASRMPSGSIDRALVDMKYSANVTGFYGGFISKTIGGIVGQLGMNGTISNVVAKGSINTTQVSDNSKNVGAIVATNVGVVKNTLNMIADTATSIAVTSPFTLPASEINVIDTATGNRDAGAKVVTSEQATKIINDWNIKSFSDTVSDGESNTSNSTDTEVVTDYTKVTGATESKKVAYENISKLLPFYDPKTIVKYGNKVSDTDKLARTKITSVLTMKDETPTNVTTSNVRELNKILVHYADGTVQKLDIKPVGFFKDTKVYEYSLGNDLFFTPEQFVVDRQSVVSELVKAYKAIDFESEEMKKAVNLPEAQKTTPSLKMDDLFWKSTFNDVKDNIENILAELLSSDDVLGESTAIDSTIKEKLSKDKEKILTGLSYISRLYDIHYGDLSIKNILLYHPEFYGNKKDLLEWLTSFSDLSFKDLQVQQNVKAFANNIASVTNSKDLVDFLVQNKAKFLPEGTMAEWFKSTTKASVYEVKSKAKPDEDVSLYAWLTSNQNYYAHYLLPLLNLRDDSIYATTNITFMGFGIKDRHLTQIEKANPTERKKALDKLEKETIPNNAERWATFTDMWYNVVDSSVKNVLVKPRLSVYSGYFFPNEGVNSWLSPYDTKYKAMEDFFASTGNWFDDDIKIAAYAYTATDLQGYHTELNFRRADLLTNSGASTLTHEFTHALDFLALLDGNKRRPGQDAESFAMGLLQSTRSNTDYYYGFNFIQNYGGEAANHNQVNTRFSNAQDLGEYMKGVFDLTYTLDSIEAEALLALPKESQRAFFDKLDLVYDNPQKQENAQDQIRAITDNEWNSMTLTTINDLIDNNLVKRDTIVNTRRFFNHNEKDNYTFVSLYSPIYGAKLNDKGTGGGLQFRKVSLELLADKGWHEGLIPYASDKLQKVAAAEGKVYSDEYVFKKIIGNEYTDYAAFKKAKYKGALEKAKSGQLKSITIDLKGQTVVIDNYDTLSKLMTNAVNADAKNSNSREVDILKSAIVKAVHSLTKDFRTSIYK